MPDHRPSAMLDCDDGEKNGNANCKHCQANGDTQKLYWDIQLDQDLLETIVSIYPEWFKDYNMNVATDGHETSENGSSSMCLSSNNSKAPPEKIIENGSLQKNIDKNKESLKVKLMLRRPLNQLVDQGIVPSLKSPPAFHEQRQKLERAKMGDFLKHKIQKRPDRRELIQQHILEDSSVDPSLQDKQRQLKRARLADGLNDRLSQRPGPLELVKVNILQADEILAQAVRGSLSYKNTCDTPSPSMRVSLDEDSGSDAAFSPSPPYEFNEHSQGSLPSLEASPNPNQGSPCSGRTSFSMSPPSSVSSPLSIHPAVVSPAPEQILIGAFQPKEPPPPKNRKKTKPKTQPKARTIKFHEYKGPPNAQKNVPTTSSSNSVSESSYDLLLQQQQLFLQWQLEWQQKYPQVVLQATQKTNGDQIGQTSPTNQTQQLVDSPASPQKLLSKLEDLKVSDLKAELKKRNLPVSGSKPLLIERLKSYAESPQNAGLTSGLSINVGGILLDTVPAAIPEADNDAIKALLRPAEADTLDITDISDSSSTSLSNEDIVQLQQRCIEKLQRELEREDIFRSQLQLQQSIVCQQTIPSTVTTSNTLSAVSAPATTEQSEESDSKATQRQIIHQYLQQKIQHQLQKQKLESQKQETSLPQGATTNTNSTLTALLESRPMNAVPSTSSTNPVASFPTSIMSTQVVDGKMDLPLETVKSELPNGQIPSFPGVTPLLVCRAEVPKASLPNGMSNRSSSLPSFSALLSCKPAPARSNTDPQFLIARPPPDYNEATRQLNKHQMAPAEDPPRQTKKHKTSVKSQAVDDVLEILIKNGELPPSAAQEPQTPKTEVKSFVAPTKAPPSSPQDKDKDDIHLASLQSVLDMTPPSSAGFGSAPTSSLDFDFHLDIEDMELEELEDRRPVASGADPTMPFANSKETKPITTSNAHGTSEAPDTRLADRGMDMELLEWLEVLEEIPGSASSLQRAPSYGIANDHDHDPLFSNFTNSDDTFDLFSGDNMDFKPHQDFSYLPWGEKSDFAT